MRGVAAIAVVLAGCGLFGKDWGQIDARSNELAAEVEQAKRMLDGMRGDVTVAIQYLRMRRQDTAAAILRGAFNASVAGLHAARAAVDLYDVTGEHLDAARASVNSFKLGVETLKERLGAILEAVREAGESDSRAGVDSDEDAGVRDVGRASQAPQVVSAN